MRVWSVNFWMNSSSNPDPASVIHCLSRIFSLPPTLLHIHLISFSNWTISVVGVIRMSKVSSNLWIVIQADSIFRHTCLEPRWSGPLRWLWWGWLWSRLQVSCSGLLQAVPSLGLCAEKLSSFNFPELWSCLSCLYAKSLLIICWAFSPAVFSRNMDPCPGLPGQITFNTLWTRFLSIWTHLDPENVALSIEKGHHFFRPSDPFVETKANVHRLELGSVDKELHSFQASYLAAFLWFTKTKHRDALCGPLLRGQKQGGSSF